MQIRNDKAPEHCTGMADIRAEIDRIDVPSSRCRANAAGQGEAS